MIRLAVSKRGLTRFTMVVQSSAKREWTIWRTRLEQIAITILAIVAETDPKYRANRA